MGTLIKSDSVSCRHPDAVYLVECEADIRPRRLPEDEEISPEEQAQRIVAQAEARADSIIEAAKAESESIRVSAREEGYQVGREEWDDRKRVLEQQMEALEAETQRQVDEHWASLEPELLALSMEIARKIVRHEIDQHQEYILSAIKSALYQLRDKREVKLHLNTADYEFLKERKDEIRASFDGLQSVELIEDRRIEKGGVLIESVSGHLDARLESQFAEVEKTLTETAHHG